MSHYFSNVTVFDGRTVKTKQGVHVAGGTIEWIGAHARAPQGRARAHRTSTARGRTLTPGLIDCHVHLSFDGGADFAGEAAGLTPGDRGDQGVAQRDAAPRARGHDRPRPGRGVLGDLRGRGARSIEGIVPGPRILAAGRALTVTGGHGHNLSLAREVDGADERPSGGPRGDQGRRPRDQGDGDRRGPHARDRRDVHRVHPGGAGGRGGRGAQVGAWRWPRTRSARRARGTPSSPGWTPSSTASR